MAERGVEGGAVPTVMFSSEDEALVEELLERFAPERDAEITRLRANMPADDWEVFVDYMHKDLRQQAQMAMIAKAVVVTAQELGIADRSGVEKFLASDGTLFPNFGQAWEQGSRDHGETESFLGICNDLRRAAKNETAAALARLTKIDDELRSAILPSI